MGLIIIDTNNINCVNEFTIERNEAEVYIKDNADKILCKFINYPAIFIIPIITALLNDDSPQDLDYSLAIYKQNNNIVINNIEYNHIVNEFIRDISIKIYTMVNNKNYKLRTQYPVNITSNLVYDFQSDYLTTRHPERISKDDVYSGKINLVDYEE